MSLEHDTEPFVLFMRGNGLDMRGVCSAQYNHYVLLPDERFNDFHAIMDWLDTHVSAWRWGDFHPTKNGKVRWAFGFHDVVAAVHFKLRWC